MSSPLAGILVMGLTVLAIRSAAFLFAGRMGVPDWLKGVLGLVVPSIIAGLLASSLLYDRQTKALDLSFGNDYLAAGALTLLLALRVRNLLALTALGFAIFTFIRMVTP